MALGSLELVWNCGPIPGVVALSPYFWMSSVVTGCPSTLATTVSMGLPGTSGGAGGVYASAAGSGVGAGCAAGAAVLWAKGLSERIVEHPAASKIASAASVAGAAILNAGCFIAADYAGHLIQERFRR